MASTFLCGDEVASGDVDARLSQCFTALAVACSRDVSEVSPSFAIAMVNNTPSQMSAFTIACEVI